MKLAISAYLFKSAKSKFPSINHFNPYPQPPIHSYRCDCT
uniref:Uncharacterized protein n=1 Tax=Arundo donax TaxID=35708 RepID=A0A0A9HJN8_ARUDO